MLSNATINDKLQWVRNYLAEQGIEAPRLEAEIIVGHVLGLSRIELYRDLLQAYPEEKNGQLVALVQKRAEHLPIAYLIGTQEFMSLAFKVNPKVLIPRPETEMLVEFLISRLEKHEESLILDVGTGSGAIAVSLAKYLPKAKIIALDLSPEALIVAKENAQANKVADRISFYESNLLAAVGEELQGKVTAIAANLPYIPESERFHLQPDVGLYEPELALYAGEDGFALYRALIPTAYRYLAKGGLLALEIGLEQGRLAVEHLSEEQWQEVNVNKDFQNLDRLVTAVKK